MIFRWLNNNMRCFEIEITAEYKKLFDVKQ